MIDPNLPLELDDGTPVTFFRVYDGVPDKIYVRVPVGASVYRRVDGGGGSGFWYDRQTGIFGGGDEQSYKVLRNSILDSFECDLDL